MLGNASLRGADSRAADYPFLKYIQMFTATGGCYKGYQQPCCACDKSWYRDLFLNNSVGPASGLNTAAWVDDLRVVLENGYLPQIVVANVPIALTSPAVLAKWGFNGLNVAPPDSYPEYQEYVRGLAAAAVKAFGIDSVRQWRWTVFTEFNNVDWFRGVPPGAPGANTTFLKLYDYTVCGLRQALGRENLIVGAHGCLQCEDDTRHYGPPLNRWGYNWNPRDLLDHIHRNVSACDPGGTQLDYTSTSFCECRRDPSSPSGVLTTAVGCSNRVTMPCTGRRTSAGCPG
eukprot:SAG22_NODE_1327_length_4730_cov_3.576549_6_plen_287_part_00